MSRTTLYGRHFCSECHTRVFPGDTFEALTEAPGLGARGAPILLSSANSMRRTRGDALMAWCWNTEAHGTHGKWVETYRKDKYDIQVDYVKRIGVTFHFNGQVGAVGRKIAEKQFAKKLEQRLESAHSATIEQPKLRVLKRKSA